MRAPFFATCLSLLLLLAPSSLALRALSSGGGENPPDPTHPPISGASPLPACGTWLLASRGWRCSSLAPNFNLHWAQPNATTIELVLEAQPPDDLTALDWFAVGLSEGGGMPGADIALLQRSDSARAGWNLTDMFATGNHRPDVDAQQDKKLLAVEETAAGLVRARVVLPLLSCDDKQDRPIVAGIPSFVIYAFGHGPFSYHGASHRGSTVLTFVPDNSTSAASSSSASETHTLTIQMPGIPIPTNDTDPYLCMDFELPGTEATPYHIIDFTTFKNTTHGISQPSYVHHMVLYNCTGKPATFGSPAPYSCADTMSNCSTFVLVSTSEDVTTALPPEAGFRMGVGAMRWVTLQVHYNNVQLDPGLVDSSGFKATYTPRLRPNDMGVMALGMVDFSVPASSTWSTGPTICPPGCTQRFTAPVHMVYGLLHMHRIGKAMSTQHYRRDNGTGAWRELQPVGVRDYFSFGFQPDLVVPSATALLLPGDALVTTCAYSNPYPYNVSFGHRSSDEMCFNFLMYYPVSAVDGVSQCLETPSLRAQGRVMCTSPEELPNLRGSHTSAPATAAAGAIARVTASSLPSQAQAMLARALPERQASLLQNATPYVPPRPSTCPLETA